MFRLPLYVGIILRRGAQVLLIKRRNSDWMSEYWNFPGGLVEEHETLARAAIREAREEINVQLDARSLSLVHVLHVQANEQNTKDIIGVYFMAENWQGKINNNEPEKHSAIEWFEVAHLPEQITQHALQALHGLQTHTTYSEHGK